MGGRERVKARIRISSAADVGVGDGPGEPEASAAPSAWAERGMSAVLTALTLVSTLTAGALLQGRDPFMVEYRPLLGFPFRWPGGFDPEALWAGASFALPFVVVLLAHEWAHRITAHAHGVRASLPYLIPFPPHISVVGTLGGFIRLKSSIPSRKALLDIGLSGPVSSLLLSVPLFCVGLLLSHPSEMPARVGLPFVIVFQEIPIRLGEPLLVQALVWLLPGVGTETTALHLHPLAFAGWLGLMLTFLNLLPLARLDGGHILHGLDPGRQRWWARATVLVFVAMGFIWVGWWLWAALMLLLGRARPLPMSSFTDDARPGFHRRALAWVVMMSLLALLPPVPVSF